MHVADGVKQANTLFQHGSMHLVEKPVDLCCNKSPGLMDWNLKQADELPFIKVVPPNYFDDHDDEVSVHHGQSPHVMRLSLCQYLKRVARKKNLAVVKPKTMLYKCTKAKLNWNPATNLNPLDVNMADHHHQSSHVSKCDDSLSFALSLKPLKSNASCCLKASRAKKVPKLTLPVDCFDELDYLESCVKLSKKEAIHCVLNDVKEKALTLLESTRRLKVRSAVRSALAKRLHEKIKSLQLERKKGQLPSSSLFCLKVFQGLDENVKFSFPVDEVKAEATAEDEDESQAQGIVLYGSADEDEEVDGASTLTFDHLASRCTEDFHASFVYPQCGKPGRKGIMQPSGSLKLRKSASMLCCFDGLKDCQPDQDQLNVTKLLKSSQQQHEDEPTKSQAPADTVHSFKPQTKEVSMQPVTLNECATGQGQDDDCNIHPSCLSNDIGELNQVKVEMDVPVALLKFKCKRDEASDLKSVEKPSPNYDICDSESLDNDVPEGSSVSVSDQEEMIDLLLNL
jgi:hypothetical protein